MKITEALRRLHTLLENHGDVDIMMSHPDYADLQVSAFGVEAIRFENMTGSVVIVEKGVDPERILERAIREDSP